MERKSIGSFIAALRRANGLTQKDLAERLTVSDKAVSRWERDESLPDLTLLPMLADIFNITVDELLRGERKVDVSDMDDAQIEKTEEAEQARLAKQTRRVANAAISRLRSKLVLAWGIAFAGVLAALICNFGISRGLLGFFVGLVCLAAASGTVYLFAKSAWQTMDEEDYDADAVTVFHKDIIDEVKRTAIIIVAMLAMVLPMSICIGGASWGAMDVFIAADNYLYGVMLCLALCMTVLSIGFCVVNGHLAENGLYFGRRGIHKIILQALCGVMAVTMIELPINYNTDYEMKMGTTFDNVEDFVAYMEELWNNEREFATGNGSAEWIGGDTYLNSGVVLYRTPEDGVEIVGESLTTEEELREMYTRKLRDADGNVIAEYLYPDCVSDVRATSYDGDRVWNFTVTLDRDRDFALQKRGNIQAILLALLMIEPVIAGAIWLGLRRKN